MRVPSKVLALLAVGALGHAALADNIFPPAQTPGYDHWKTPPMQNSELFSVPLFYHSTTPYSNWGGVVVDVLIDPNPREANFFGAGATAPFFRTFGQSSVSSVPVVTFWHPSATQSGTTNPASVTVQLGSLNFHASHTDPANNSDTDIEFSAWNIFHVTEGQNIVGTIPPSVLLYVRPGEAASQWGQGPPIAPGAGHWVHNPFPKVVNLTNLTSFFFATGTNITGAWGVGVEHVPEPAAAAMLFAGAGVLFAARRRRRA
jgi:hypothetical protein